MDGAVKWRRANKATSNSKSRGNCLLPPSHRPYDQRPVAHATNTHEEHDSMQDMNDTRKSVVCNWIVGNQESEGPYPQPTFGFESAA